MREAQWNRQGSGRAVAPASVPTVCSSRRRNEPEQATTEKQDTQTTKEGSQSSQLVYVFTSKLPGDVNIPPPVPGNDFPASRSGLDEPSMLRVILVVGVGDVNAGRTCGDGGASERDRTSDLRFTKSVWRLLKYLLW